MRNLILCHRKKITQAYFRSRKIKNGEDDYTSDSLAYSKGSVLGNNSVYVNSLSAWRQERYHGDGGVSNGGITNEYDVLCNGTRGGDQNNFDDDGAYYDGDQKFYSGDGDQNFHSGKQSFHEGEHKFCNSNYKFCDDNEKVYDNATKFHDDGGQQFDDGGDIEFYDGNEEFHGGNDHFDDSADQYFYDEAGYQNEHDGKHFADDY